jgi:cytosine/creatinine deaminase
MLLQSVRIPEVLRGFAVAGDVFDVSINGARITQIVPGHDQKPSGTLISALVDAHVHIDKTYVVNESGAAAGDLSRAIDIMAHHREGWTAQAIAARMERALAEAYASGTRAMRTHLDWMTPAAPLSWQVAQQKRTEWAGRVALQMVSITPLDLFADAQNARQIAATLKADGGIIGAFVYRNADLHTKLENLFRAAAEYGLMLDIHVDEGLDADANGLAMIAQKVIHYQMQQRVTCGHACSLSIQERSQSLTTLALCAEAQLHLIALPTTNAYLQGAWDKTPVERGITLLREARNAGINTCIATDNVADAFYPYGSYDLMEAFRFGVMLAHLSPPGDWLRGVTLAPARAMQLDWDGRISEGAPADLVLFAATDEHALLRPAGLQRRVMRKGVWLQ